MGLGVDLVEIDRLERALRRHPRLKRRIFTAAECEYAEGRARPARHLAARFAAKEAVIKALGISTGFGLAQIEVIGSAPPRVRLSGPPARAAAGKSVEISLTHSRDFAAAIAVAKRCA